MSHEAFERMEQELNKELHGKDSPFGKNNSIAEVHLIDVLLSSPNYADLNLRIWFQEKPKRYTWLWVAEWPDGTFANIRSEKDPWYNHVSRYYYKEPIKVYKIEESKQETPIE